MTEGDAPSDSDAGTQAPAPARQVVAATAEPAAPWWVAQPEAAADTAPASVRNADADVADAPVAEAPSTPVVMAAAEPPAVAAEAAVERVSAPVAAAAPAAPVVATAPVAAVAAVPNFELPLDSLQAVAESAGLQWVNSDTAKIRAVQAAMAAEAPPAHVPRERKPLVAADDGALVLVETRKDLSQFKLPFESGAGTPPAA